jgi:type I restriction enzyme S subunit
MGYIPTFDYEGEALTWTTDGANAGTVFYRNGKFNCTNICGILQLKGNGSFINYMLYSVGYSAINCRRADTNGYKIMSNEMAEIVIALPPLSEQQKIASFLDEKCSEIDEMVVLQEKIIEELKAYKQSVITEAVTKGLNPDVPMKDSGIEWIGEIPESWEICRIKNVCSQNTNSLSEKEDSALEFDYVDIGSVSFEKGIFNTEHYKFKDAPSRARRKACYGDLIMSTVRTYLRAIDVIDTEVKANYIYSTGFAVLTPKSHISYKFLSYISKSQYFLEQVTMLSRGINYPSINSTDLMTITILHPPLSEQQSIASYLDEKCSEIDNLISIKQSKIESLKEYKKSIIYEYVTGKKEVE